MRAALDDAGGVNAAAGHVFLHGADLAPAVGDRLDRSALELVTGSAPQAGARRDKGNAARHRSSPPVIRCVALVLALRSGEPATPAPVEVVRAMARTRTLRPRPLTEEASGQLVRDELGAATGAAFCAACHRATGGSPYLLAELIRDLRERGVAPTDEEARRIGELVPDSVARTTIARVRRHGLAGSALARALAILESARPHQAARLAGLDEDASAAAAARLEEAGVLAAGLPLRFAHPLQRAAMLSELSAAERERAHRRAAAILDDPTAVVSHLLQCDARGDDWAVEALHTAGRRALAEGSPEGARRLLRCAVEEASESRASAALLLELAQGELGCGDPQALVRLDQAVARARDPQTRATALAALGNARYLQGDVDGAVVGARAALGELAGGGGSSSLEPALLLSYGLGARSSRAHIGDLRALLELPRAGAAAEAVRRVLRGFDGLLRGEPRARLDELVRAPAGDAALTSERGLAADALPVGMSAFVLAGIDDYAAAERILRQLLARARRQGSVIEAAVASEARAWSRWLQGLVPGALADCDTVLALAERGWELQAVAARATRAELLLELGDMAAADETLQLAPQLEARLEGVWGHVWLPYARSGLALARGDHSAALEQALICGERMLAIDAGNPGFCAWRSRAALAAAALGEIAHARELHREELRRARAFGGPRSIAVALRTAGVVEGGEDGLALLTEAVAVLEGSQALLERGRALVALGAALRRARGPRAARAPLRAGLELALECGAGALAARAREELHAAGARPRRERTRGPAALTPRELRVAELAVDGLSNPEITQALFVSRHTVESHLHSAYVKLGIHGREELAAALRPRPGQPAR